MANEGERHGPVGLYEHELGCLVALARLMVGLDRRFSDAESDVLSSIALEVGEDSFWKHVQASYDTELELGTALELAKKVERVEARNVIFASLADLALADGIELVEQGLLSRLEQLWGLEPIKAS